MLFLSLLFTNYVLSCSVDAYTVRGIELASSESYLRRNFAKLMNFHLFASSVKGDNRTILTYTFNDMSMIKLIHRDSHLFIEVFQNEEFIKRCRYSYEGKSFFHFYLRFANKEGSMRISSYTRSPMNSCSVSFENLDLQKSSTLCIGDPFQSGHSFEGTLVWIEYTPSPFPNVCFSNLKSDIGFQRQINKWKSHGAGYSNKGVHFIEMCENVGRVFITEVDEVNGFNPIQSDFCNVIYGRFLDKEEIRNFGNWNAKKLVGTATIWTSTRCEVVDLSLNQTIRTCLPGQAYFACFIPRFGFKIKIFIDYEMEEILLESRLRLIEGKYGSKYHFKSHGQSKFNISYKEGKWHFDFESRNDSYLLDSPTPFGKHSWQSKVAKGHTHEIVIENCLGKLSCGDGTCYSGEEFCDRVVNCKNGRDELRCDTPYKVDPYYDTAACCSEQTVNCDDTIKVNYLASVVDIQEIKAEHEKITMTMQLTFRWRDHRLLFTQTDHKFINGSLLPLNPSRDLILNQKESATNTEKNITDSIFWFDKSKLKGLQNTRDIPIWNKFKLEFSFPCPFDFTEFPFGRQTFNISLSFDNCYSDYELLNMKSQINVEISTKQRGDFILRSLSEENTDLSRIEILISLESLSSYYVLTSFTPSVLMCCIAYCTLYFKMAAFGERITVSSTALLTLSVMFTDVGDKIVRTSYPKLIDYWFIGCIAYSAFIVLLNGLVHYLGWHSWNFSRWFRLFRTTSLTRSSGSYVLNPISYFRDEGHLDTIGLNQYHPDDSSQRTQGQPSDHNHMSQPTRKSTSEPEHVERYINNVGRVVLLAIIVVSIVVLKLRTNGNCDG